jgi:hypothetical protein
LTDRAFRDPINVPPTAEPSEAASVPASAQGIARLSGGLKRRLTLFAPPLCAKNGAEVIAAHIVGMRTIRRAVVLTGKAVAIIWMQRKGFVLRYAAEEVAT